MPRLRRSDKRKYDRVTIELRCVLANAQAAGDPDTWVEYWGSPEEARRAWDALRSRVVSQFGRPTRAHAGLAALPTVPGRSSGHPPARHHAWASRTRRHIRVWGTAYETRP